jgi:transposase-like protein
MRRASRLLKALLFAGLLLVPLPPPRRALAAEDSSAKATDLVTFNVKTLKIHCPSCSAARRCTKSCVDIPRADAIKRGGVACKLCGGVCRR